MPLSLDPPTPSPLALDAAQDPSPDALAARSREDLDPRLPLYRAGFAQVFPEEDARFAYEAVVRVADVDGRAAALDLLAGVSPDGAVLARSLADAPASVWQGQLWPPPDQPPDDTLVASAPDDAPLLLSQGPEPGAKLARTLGAEQEHQREREANLAVDLSIPLDQQKIVVDTYGFVVSGERSATPGIYLQTADGERKLGDLGGPIDINEVYAHLLERNAAIAEDMPPFNPGAFRDLVKNDAPWDYKHREDTLYGLVDLHLRRTKDYEREVYSFDGDRLTADDIGNFHYGVVGLASPVPFFTETFLLKQAGAAQVRDGTSRPEWQNEEVHHPPFGMGGFGAVVVPHPPYGDDPADQAAIRDGFAYYRTRFE